MSNVAPELHGILDAADDPTHESAWEAFVARHSKLLLHLAHDVMPTHDGALDAYAFVLQQLRRDNYRILRSYTADDRCRFSTWLAVVARRTCVDFYRQEYGRPRSTAENGQAKVDRIARLRLVRMVGAPVDMSQIADNKGEGPESQLRFAQRNHALAEALEHLAPADRLLLKLRFEDDLSAREIAPVINAASPFHVYRRLRAVCAELRKLLANRGIEESAP